MTTKELEKRKSEVAERILKYGQQQTADYYNINRNTLRDFLYREGLPTKMKEKDSKEVPKESERALLEVAEICSID